MTNVMMTGFRRSIDYVVESRDIRQSGSPWLEIGDYYYKDDPQKTLDYCNAEITWRGKYEFRIRWLRSPRPFVSV